MIDNQIQFFLILFTRSKNTLTNVSLELLPSPLTCIANTIIKIIPTSKDIPSALNLIVTASSLIVPYCFTANSANNVATKVIAAFLNPCWLAIAIAGKILNPTTIGLPTEDRAGIKFTGSILNKSTIA